MAGTTHRSYNGPRTFAAMLACFAVSMTAGGCSVGAVDIADLNFKRLNPQSPLMDHHEVAEGWWWIDGDRVYVSLHDERGGFLGRLSRKRFDMSIVLEGLPAARSRDYALGRESVRAYVRHGARHARFASLRGVAGLRFEPGGIVRGRFRMMAKKQVFHVLTGWHDAGQAAVFGEFQARLDRTRGEEILRRTEEDGMERHLRRAGTQPSPPQPGRPQPVRVQGPPVG